MSESDQGAAADQGGAAGVPPHRHVLLVEDEELVAMAMAEELKAGGWTVIGPATTLDEAQALVTSDIVLDAAILDIHLHGRWVHTLAEDLERRGVPFVVCTGYEMVDPEGRFASAPLIVKPIAPHRLAETLDALLNRSPVTPPLEPGRD
jgi:DNA-binding response OmpR family regulator